MTMRFDKRFVGMAALVLAAVVFPWHMAWAKSWVGPTGDWNTPESWNPAGIPVAGEAVTVSVGNAVISLTNETALLGSFAMTGGKLVFSNWTSRLMATNVTISGGTVTVANAFSETDMSNRVWIVCSNDFTLSSPGRIDVNNLGYLPSAGPGKGVPESSSYCGGGGHGGKGGIGYYNGGPANDSLTEPGSPGSGGGGTNSIGGCGGGVVRIEAGSTASVSGMITANGQTAPDSHGGGGAGGTICIVAAAFTGTTNGLLQANGSPSINYRSGSGGGGRIAVIGGTVSSPLLVRFSTAPGAPVTGTAGLLPYGSSVNAWADWGTVYIADANVLTGMPQNNQFTKTVLQAGSATSWTVSQLTLTNNSFRLSPDGFLLTVTGDLTVGTNAELGIRGSIVCGGNLMLTNNGQLTVFSGPTNATSSYGALVTVAGNLLIAGYNAWLRPNADPINGGGVLFRVQNLVISHTNSGINACGRGFGPGQGPGAGNPSPTYAGGGGYGGRGYSVAPGGAANGNPYGPLLPGSAGGLHNALNLTDGAGYGGGLIRVEASNSVKSVGFMLAQGGQGYGPAENGAGGAGGGIFISCSNFEGTAAAMLDVRGGNSGRAGDAGGGGGGRIAVWHGNIVPQRKTQLMSGSASDALLTNTLASYSGSMNISTGIGVQASGIAAESGTVWFITFPTNGLPIVSITSPANESIVPTNSFPIVADAFSDGYAITQVVFLADGAVLGSDTAAPFVWNWTAVPLGAHTLTAVAWDSMGQCTTSAAVQVLAANSVKAWTLAGTGDWFEAASWTPEGVPGEGDIINLSLTGAVVTLTNETANVLAFQMTAGQLVFSNWYAKLNAGTVDISGGTVTVANAFGEMEMSNRVWIACASDFTLTAPGRIDVSGLGYAVNVGPGKGTPSGVNQYGGGGGHGGKGGVGYWNGGPAYDSLTEPGAPGSGGGCTNQGGSGGGVVRIEAGGLATIGGTIAANGQTSTNKFGGGGAGGAICIVSAVFTGTTNGLLQANGGTSGHAYGGGGGGGRIAVGGGPVSNPLQVRFSTAPGALSTAQAGVLPYGSTVNTWADWGTVYVADTNLLAGMPQNNQFTKTVLQIGSATNWTLEQLTLTNNSFRLGPDNFLLTVAGDLTIGTNAELGIRGSVECGSSLVLTNNGLLTIYSGPTNATASYGALVNVAGNMVICGSDAWLRPHTDPTNGGGVLLRMANLAITQTNAGINASGRGFGPGQGPGKAAPSGQYSGGGAYGGSGQKGFNTPGGTTNGNLYAPLLPGGGGGARTNTTVFTDQTDGTGFGGGLIRVEASNSVTLEGQLVAQGGRGRDAVTYGAGGAGGGIWVSCRTFTGSTNAVLDASGGDTGISGSGGGGRIAVWSGAPMPEQFRAALLAGAVPSRVGVANQLETYQGTLSVTNGGSGNYIPYATPGTVVFVELLPRLTGSLMLLY